MATFSLFTSSYTINLIDRSQSTTNMDSFNDITSTLTSQSIVPRSPPGILIFCCCLVNLTEIKLESTPSAPFDDSDVSSSVADSKWHIKWCYRRDTYYKYHQIRYYVPSPE